MVKERVVEEVGAGLKRKSEMRRVEPLGSCSL